MDKMLGLGLIVITNFFTTTLYGGKAGEGKLSQGKLKPKATDTTLDRDKSASVPVPGAIAPCYRQLFNPPGRRILFSDDGINSYHLFQAQKETIISKSLPDNSTTASPETTEQPAKQEVKNAKKPTDPEPNSTPPISYRATSLFRFNFRDLKGNLLRKGILPQVDSFLVSGSSSKGAVLVAFDPSSSNCGAGTAVLYHVRYADTNKPVASKNGRYALVDSGPGMAYLFDMTYSQLVSVETDSFQLRKFMFPFTKPFRPLAVEAGDQGAFLWKPGTQGEPQGLGFTRNYGAFMQKFSFNFGESLIQDGRYFSALKISEKNNTLAIIEIPKWSGHEEQREFKITLPRGFPVSEATGRIRLKDHKIVILGSTEMLRQRWHKAFVFDYEKSSKPLTEIDFGKDAYVSEVDFHPNGLHIVAQGQNIKDESKLLIYLYSFALKKSQTFRL